jgi:tetratricopeptide (TPR) repeat protein
MANAEGIHPARYEVERQLERVLADEIVASNPQPAKLLAFIVRRVLDGDDVTEKSIREYMFPTPPYKEDSNIARITMDNVRKLLAEYYENEGLEDPVIIDLPKSPKGKRIKYEAGQAYSPRFRYNPRHKIAQDFALANHLAMGTPSEIEESLRRYGAILELEPNHPDAVLGSIEALGRQLLQGIYTEELMREALIGASLELIARLDPATADNWRSHMLRGFLHTCGNDLDAARKEFDIALKLDYQSTVKRGWYIHFLFIGREQEEALRLLGLEAAESFNDPAVLAAYGMYLCKASRFEDAERALRHALGLDRNYWPAHWGIVLLCLSTGRPKTAQAHARLLELLLEREDYEFLMRQVNLNPSDS